MSHFATDSFYNSIQKVTNPNHLGALQAALVTKIQEQTPIVEKTNPYALTEKARDLLLRKGIQTSYFAIDTHVHAMHKVIENNFLFNIVPHKLRTGSVTFSYMKKSKFDAILEERPHKAAFWRLDNKTITPEDFTRYNDAPISHPIPNANTNTIFLHDTLHYFSPAQVAQCFEQNPRLEVLMGTIVVPVETTMEQPSFFPELYQLHYVADKLIYVPEGDHSGSYEQPISANWWLVTNKLTYTRHDGTKVFLQATKHESCYAHHLVSFRRVKQFLPCREHIIYESPRLSVIPNIFPTFPTHRRLVPYELRKKMFAYAKSVKNNAELNIEAKLRSLCSDHKWDIPEDTLFLLVKFTFELINLRREVVLRHQVKEMNPIMRYLKNTFGGVMNWNEAAYLEKLAALMDIQEHHQIYRLQQIDLNYDQVRMGNYWPSFSYALDGTDGHMKLVHEDEVNEDGEIEVFYDVPEVEEENENKVQKPDLLPATWFSPARRGNDCGLRVFTPAFSARDVERAYQTAKLAILRKVGSREKQETLRNFQELKKNKFHWLSGRELCYIAAALGTKLSIHSDTACHVQPNSYHIYNSNNTHWTPSGPQHRCKCQKHT